MSALSRRAKKRKSKNLRKLLVEHGHYKKGYAKRMRRIVPTD